MKKPGGKGLTEDFAGKGVVKLAAWAFWTRGGAER